jgi:ABC-2 type transport system ATP-binding protein
MWGIIRELVALGTTLLLTTQYLDEADELADDIVVIDHGVVIASGTSEELKDRIGGDVVEFSVTDRSRLQVAVDAVSAFGEGPPAVDTEAARVQVRAGGHGSQVLVEAVRGLDSAGVVTTGMALRRPSLDDVFMSLTGHGAEETAADGKTDGPGGRRKRSGRGPGGGGGQ